MHQFARLVAMLPLLLLLSGCPFDDDDYFVVVSEPVSTGLKTMMSGDDEREYFLQLPGDYEESTGADGEARPLLIALQTTIGVRVRIGFDSDAIKLLGVAAPPMQHKESDRTLP